MDDRCARSAQQGNRTFAESDGGVQAGHLAHLRHHKKVLCVHFPPRGCARHNPNVATAAEILLSKVTREGLPSFLGHFPVYIP